MRTSLALAGICALGLAFCIYGLYKVSWGWYWRLPALNSLLLSVSIAIWLWRAWRAYEKRAHGSRPAAGADPS